MSAERTCRHCRHFDDDPVSLERRLPHLAILGSAYSSTRGGGLCAVTDRFLEPLRARECPHFAERQAEEGAPPSDP